MPLLSFHVPSSPHSLREVSSDIHVLCKDLLSASQKIVSNGRNITHKLPKATQKDVIFALQHVKDSVERSSPATKPEKWAANLDKVIAKLAPIIDPLATSTSIGSVLWGSIHVFVKVFIDPQVPLCISH